MFRITFAPLLLTGWLTLSAAVLADPPCDMACDAVGPPVQASAPCANLLSCDSLFGDEGFLSSDEKLLAPLQKQKFADKFEYSVGGELRFRYLDEKNRLRPPVPAGQSSYSQWRFTPYLELTYGDITGYVQAIDASTFGNELPDLIIDENRADLLQAYVDINLLEFEKGGKLRYRYGRQTLKYGSQHLVSPLGWANTFRNFEGHKVYYTDETWDIDAFAVQPVHEPGAISDKPRSFDSADASQWFSGVYSSYKKAPKGSVDVYWLWKHESEDRADRIDGSRHTMGMRYAGKNPIKADAGPCQKPEDAETLLTLNWDWEAAIQAGNDDFLTGANQQINGAFLSVLQGVGFDQMPLTPNLAGIFWFGSGDTNPGDGKLGTVSTLFPLGHAYWGQLDNFSGQNLLDYGVHLTVNPTKKLSVLTGYHYFDKAAREDAIYNIAGAPFGGVSTTSRHLGDELDVITTYQVNKNLQLQGGYSLFWYGDAVTNNPNPLVANRDDARQVYFLVDWAF